jgi:hypothetical protein
VYGLYPLSVSFGLLLVSAQVGVGEVLTVAGSSPRPTVLHYLHWSDDVALARRYLVLSGVGDCCSGSCFPVGRVFFGAQPGWWLSWDSLACSCRPHRASSGRGLYAFVPGACWC